MPIKLMIHTVLLLSFVACVEKQAISENEAIKIAEQELQKRYGDEVLKQKPFKVSTSEKKWIVSGTLNCSENEICSGGVGVVELDAKTGQILSVGHTK